MDRIVKLPFGEMPAGMAVDIAIFDVTTHAWDLAKATGQSTDSRSRGRGASPTWWRRTCSTTTCAASGLFGPGGRDRRPTCPPPIGWLRSPVARRSGSGGQRVGERHARAPERLGDRRVHDLHRSAVFTPFANSGSLATASAHALGGASATAYGSVALVSA